MKTVMVTGVGAIMGYGLLKSLREAAPSVRLVGTDIYDDAVGRAWSDVFEQAPYTAASEYGQWLGDTLARYKVDLLIPGIEQDVHWLSDNRALLAQWDCQVVLNNPHLIDLSRDKWAMDQALVALGDPSRIPSLLSGDFHSLEAALGLPFLLKPRRSYASKGLVWVREERDFTPHAALLGDYLMAQPIIGSAADEFTVAAFGDGQGNTGPTINFQRRLASDGSTAKAWVYRDDALDQVVARLCRAFKPVGPTNLQFRRGHDGSWSLLEINPRISSTSSIRRAFGYNEAAMCLDHYLDGKTLTQPALRGGFAVRYIEDFIVYDRDHF
ncbi:MULTISPECIES: ATP-grasp domain-containing protein [unclassified Pseudomonas]|uniref:ATP-grasp domain-containing protein n=1 Tax=unclassified Pseudomonas TaxID=196821 RepID=UPI00087679CD|nr:MULTISPECIES: ATP-grasp domain-containing protein [unclassified Pseudomonas]SCX40029.1 carbamoyl-phosphate synthase large subunit [Pseudomonas sp. NFACC32-1]SFW98734.1 carbamoyl-phosphate synthase large subunit [Pseudomonas sp. NFACC47-1]SFX24238.1 carbamoyl-phosphate synthase large subunit [Pseudomonas sp. NFACC36]SFX24573.1 carbamoyl-phosphate synthase large subunit [Pseudomonas sp. NFACC43]